MSAAIVAAVIVGGATAYGARQQKKAAEEAAKGSQVTPWGPTGGYMEELLTGAMDKFRAGNFQFGPQPSIYNAYLGFGRGNLGLDIPKSANLDPANYSYGPQAYQYMLDMMMGPGFSGASRSQPQYLMGAQDPWVSGILGGVGAYSSLYGMGGGGGYYNPGTTVTRTPDFNPGTGNYNTVSGPTIRPTGAYY